MNEKLQRKALLNLSKDDRHHKPGDSPSVIYLFPEFFQKAGEWLRIGMGQRGKFSKTKLPAMCQSSVPGSVVVCS